MITERIAKNINRGKGPQITADQLIYGIRRALERDGCWLIETAPHPRGGVAVTAALLQSSIDDRGHVNLIIVAGRGVVLASTSESIHPMDAMEAALRGARRPRVFSLSAEATAEGWKIWLRDDKYDEEELI